MLNKLLALIRRYDMLQHGDRLICAISGGADSVALLFAMYLLREKLGICLEAAHFNHKLRGEESDRDEAFVRALCDRYDIPLHVGSTEVVAGKKGLEAAARDARYGFFETLNGKIATAHTADDNAETVLMHMVRGTGLKGLGGISPVRGKLIRPMLLVTRQQVLDFLAQYHLSYAEDSSNETDAFLRNRLRHHVMPLLKQENPQLSENLSAMALRLRQDEEALSRLPDIADGLDINEVKKLHPAQRSRLLDTFLKSAGVKEPDSSNIAQAEALILSDNPSAKGNFPGGVTVCRRYDTLVSVTKEEPLNRIELNCPCALELPRLGVAVRCRWAEEIINTKTTFTIHPTGKVVLRCREAGDTIRLSGGTKSLKKLFIDRKIPADCRDLIPVLADEKGVLGVYGIGVNRDREAENLPAIQIQFEVMEANREKKTRKYAGGL